MVKISGFIFSIIILIAVFFRFFSLSSVPPSPSLDEVSIGYNAYSILKTGKDEFGESFPLLLRAYDDWRPALYVYLVIPFVGLFGLTAQSVRLPSVMLSITTVITTYFLVKKLLVKTKGSKEQDRKAHWIALIAMLLLAISPWHIYLSRLGHEVNAGLSFFVLAATLFLYERYPLSIIFFVLSFISYQSEKIFVPVIVLFAFLLFRNEIRKRFKLFLIGSFAGIVIVIPFLFATLSPNALIRLRGTNIFTANRQRYEKQAVLLMKSKQEGDILGQILNNRRFLSAEIVTEAYVSHFNPQWLFTNPSADRHKVPNLGLLYLWEAPFILLGMFFFLGGRYDSRKKILTVVWFLGAPLAASITTDAPHAMRSYTFLPLYQLFSSIGIYYLWRKAARIPLARYVGIALFAVVILFSSGYLFNQYFFTFPKTQSGSFQYALYQAIPFVLSNEKPYTDVIFSNRDNLYQSYMFFLFFSRYDPITYQKEGGTQSGGFAKEHKFGKYTFRPINWDVDRKKERSIILVNPWEFPKNVTADFVGKNLDGEEAVKVVITQ